MGIPYRRNAVALTLALGAMTGAIFFAGEPSRAGIRQNQSGSDPTFKRIESQLGKMRSMPDDKRAELTKQLALEIRQLPKGETKVLLAMGLSNLATEGDFGKSTLQEVANTLAQSMAEKPAFADKRMSEAGYQSLARLVHYEGMKAHSDSPEFKQAMDQFAKNDASISQTTKADFTLHTLDGKAVTLSALKGKVVLVNFWATWCPPCRKELPDMLALYEKFKDKGFVIVGITDEKPEVVKPFVTKQALTYPILLDNERKVNQKFNVQGIPFSVIYDRSGKLTKVAVDMRTNKQLLEMLASAGLH
jgi:peroxiredoxin